jgi:hypothetical protein
MGNLYPTKRTGFYIANHRPGRWIGQRRYGKNTKSACFYSFEEALAFVDALPDSWEEVIEKEWLRM